MAKKGVINSKKTLLERLLQWGVVLVFAVLPILYFSGWAASYVTSKQYFLIGAVEFLAVVWIWLLLRDRRYRLSKMNMLFLAPLFLFLFSLTVSSLAGIDRATSFFSTIESGTGLILLYHAFLLALIATSLLRVQQKKVLVRILQANAFAAAVLAAATFFTGDHGIWDIGSEMLNGSSGGAMMGNVLLAAAYLIFSIFLTAYLGTQEQKKNKKIFYYAAVAVMVFSPVFFNAHILMAQGISSLAGILGQARVAAVALVAGGIVSFLVWAILQEKKVFRITGWAGLVIAAVITIGCIQQLSTPGTHAHTFFVAESGNRITDWHASIEGIKEKPILGWGAENFHAVYQKHLDPIVFDPGHGNEVWALHPHNNTLEVLVNGGVIGLLFYLLVYAAIFGGIFRLYKRGTLDRKAAALLVGMLTAFIIQQQMIYESIVSYTMLFLMVAIVAGLMDVTDEPKPYVAENQAVTAISGALLVVVFPVWLYASYLPSQKMNEFQSVAKSHSDARTAQYEHLFHSAGSYAIRTDPEFYTDPLFYSYDAQRGVLKSTTEYQKIASEELTALVAAVDPVWRTSPYNYHLSLSLLELQNLRFYLTGDKALFAAADEYAKQAFALSPADPQIYYFYAQTLVNKGDIEGGKAMLDRAIAINANYKPAVEYRKAFK